VCAARSSTRASARRFDDSVDRVAPLEGLFPFGARYANTGFVALWNRILVIDAAEKDAGGGSLRCKLRFV